MKNKEKENEGISTLITCVIFGILGLYLIINSPDGITRIEGNNTMYPLCQEICLQRNASNGVMTSFNLANTRGTCACEYNLGTGLDKLRGKDFALDDYYKENNTYKKVKENNYVQNFYTVIFEFTFQLLELLIIMTGVGLIVFITKYFIQIIINKLRGL